MEPIIAYLLKMLLCSGILLGYYWIALRNERFHRWNRFYLICVLGLSVVMPFLSIPFLVSEEPAVVVTMVSNLPWNKLAVSPAFTWSWKNTLVMTGALVSMAMLLRLASSIIRVLRLYRSHPSTDFENVNLVLTAERSAPFSFFKWLFWRQDIDPDTENGKRMLQHELTHISEKHSADKLFAELLLIVFWMNPFFWIVRRELYDIHEFLADQKAISRNDGAAFAAMILQASHAGLAPTLTNPFFTSQLKRRLIMITTSRAPKYTYLRRISGLLLMLATTGVMVLSIEQTQAQQTAPPPPPPQVPPKEKVENLPDSIKSVAVIEKNGVTYIKYLMKDGRKLVYSLDQVKEKKLFLPPPPPPPPATKLIAPTPVKTVGAVPPTVPLSVGNVIKQLELESGLGNDKPIYIYAGLKITEAQMKEINPNDLERVDVLKGEEAIKAYGEMGKNGVVRITPKNKDMSPQAGAPQQTEQVTFRATSKDSQPNSNNLVKFYGVNTGNVPQPIYMINAKKASSEQLNALKPDIVASINVLKGEDAIKKYGNEGKNGAIEITTKDEATKPVEKQK